MKFPRPSHELYYEEEQIAELADIIRTAAVDHAAPNWTADLIRRAIGEDGFIDESALRQMESEWINNEFDPVEFAGRLGRLADYVAGARQRRRPESEGVV